jgi:hypothetical protein
MPHPDQEVSIRADLIKNGPGILREVQNSPDRALRRRYYEIADELYREQLEELARQIGAASDGDESLLTAPTFTMPGHPDGYVVNITQRMKADTRELWVRRQRMKTQSAERRLGKIIANASKQGAAVENYALWELIGFVMWGRRPEISDRVLLNGTAGRRIPYDLVQICDQLEPGRSLRPVEFPEIPGFDGQARPQAMAGKNMGCCECGFVHFEDRSPIGVVLYNPPGKVILEMGTLPVFLHPREWVVDTTALLELDARPMSPHDFSRDANEEVDGVLMNYRKTGQYRTGGLF